MQVKYEVNAAFNDDDWFISKLYSKAQILTVLLVGKDIIRNEHQLLKETWNRSLEKLRQIGFKRNEEIDVRWDKLRDLIKAMKRKYEKEHFHGKFEKMLVEARTMWREDRVI